MPTGFPLPPPPPSPPQRRRTGLTPEQERNRDLVRQVAEKEGVDPTLAEAVAWKESRFQTRALSPKGAQGIMQLMPGTAKRLGVKDSWNPIDNVRGGVREIKRLANIYLKHPDTIDRTLSGYNAGEGAVSKYGGIPPYRQTKEYVRAVKAHRERLFAEQYGRVPGPGKAPAAASKPTAPAVPTGLPSSGLDSASLLNLRPPAVLPGRDTPDAAALATAAPPPEPALPLAGGTTTPEMLAATSLARLPASAGGEMPVTIPQMMGAAPPVEIPEQEAGDRTTLRPVVEDSDPLGRLQQVGQRIKEIEEHFATLSEDKTLLGPASATVYQKLRPEYEALVAEHEALRPRARRRPAGPMPKEARVNVNPLTTGGEFGISGGRLRATTPTQQALPGQTPEQARARALPTRIPKREPQEPTRTLPTRGPSMRRLDEGDLPPLGLSPITPEDIDAKIAEMQQQRGIRPAAKQEEAGVLATLGRGLTERGMGDASALAGGRVAQSLLRPTPEEAEAEIRKDRGETYLVEAQRAEHTQNIRQEPDRQRRREYVLGMAARGIKVTPEERRLAGFRSNRALEVATDVATSLTTAAGDLIAAAGVLAPDMIGGKFLREKGGDINAWANAFSAFGGGKGFTSDVIKGAASSFPYLMGGLAAGARWGQVVAGVMGGFQTQGSIYQEAKSHGLSDADAQRVSVFGIPVGFTEAWGLGGTGRRLMGTKRAVKHLIGTVLREAGEEATQEGVQGVLTNLIAQGFYDPQRGILTDVPYQVLIGAIVGGGLGGGTHASQQVAMRVSARLGARADARILKRLGEKIETQGPEGLTEQERGEYQQAITRALVREMALQEGKQTEEQVPIPEKAETLIAQLDALTEGRRQAVLVTKGEKMPRLPAGPKFHTTKTKVGTFIHGPDVRSSDVRRRVQDETYGELLGHVAPRPAEGEASVVVVARNAEGQELQSSVVAPEAAEAQAEALRQQFPDATVEIGGAETAAAVIEGRQAPETAHPLPSEAPPQREAGPPVATEPVKAEAAVPPTKRPAEGKREPKRKFASTQVNLPAEQAKPVHDLASSIPDEDLAADGREAEPHITVKYGLHGEKADAVRTLLADEGPITVTLGKTSVFEGVEDGGADAVIVEVDSPDLHRLNKKIADALPHTDTYPDYRPHITLAYVKPGKGKDYAGDSALEGRSLTLDRLTFSSKTGEQIEIPLEGGPPDAAEGRVEPEGDLAEHRPAEERGLTARPGDSDSDVEGREGKAEEEGGITAPETAPVEAEPEPFPAKAEARAGKQRAPVLEAQTDLFEAGPTVESRQAAQEAEVAETPTTPLEAAVTVRPTRGLQHERFGEVTVADDQSGVPTGSLKVMDAEGNEHIIQNPRTTGNREATFVRSAEPVPEVAESKTVVDQFTDALKSRAEARREEEAVKLREAIRRRKGEEPPTLYQKDRPDIQAFESIPLPSDIKAPLLEVARSFLAEGHGDIGGLVERFEKLLGADFEYVMDYLPSVVAHAERIQRNVADAKAAIAEAPADTFPEGAQPTEGEIIEAATERMSDADNRPDIEADQGQAGEAAAILETEAAKPPKVYRRGRATDTPPVSETPTATDETAQPVTPTDKASFRKALIDRWGYEPEVAERTAEIADAFASTYAFYAKQSDPKTGTAEAKREFYGMIRVAEGEGQGALLQQFGSTEFVRTGEAIIRALANPNESTGVHELAHAVTPVFARLAAVSNAPESLQSAMRTMEQAMGFEAGEFLRLHAGWVQGALSDADTSRYRKAQEKHARAFERYLREGKSPTADLKAAFKAFKEWLSHIYRRIAGKPINVELTPELRKAWDILLGSERQQAEAAVDETDHWNFRRSTFADAATEEGFRDTIRRAVVEGGSGHKRRVSREEHLRRVEELSPDLLPEIRKMRESQIVSREVFTAAAQYSQTLIRQAQEIRATIRPDMPATESLELLDKAAALEHDAAEVMQHTIGARSEFGRNLAMLAVQKDDQLSPERVLAYGKTLAEQRGMDQRGQTWRRLSTKLVGKVNDIQAARTRRKEIAAERKTVENGNGKPKKRKAWQDAMIDGLRADAEAASARLQSQFGKKLYQEDYRLTAEETDRVRAKYEALKTEAKETGVPLRTVIDEHLRQGNLFGQELSDGQQALLRDMMNLGRRAPVKSIQGALFDPSPTVESRRDKKAEESSLLFQDAENPGIVDDLASILAARVAEESRKKDGLALGRILEEFRDSFPDIIGEYGQNIKARADEILKSARRKALADAARDPAQRTRARTELAKDVADARRAARDAERAEQKKREQVERLWERDAKQAEREASAAWNKAEVEARKARESAGAQLEKAERDAQEAFARQQRAAVIDEARRVARAVRDAEIARTQEIAEDARDHLRRVRRETVEALRAERRWDHPIRQAAQTARDKIADDPDYSPTVEELGAIMAERSLDPTMTTQRLHNEMRQSGDAFESHRVEVRAAAAQIKSDARAGHARRRLEERAAGRAAGATTQQEERKARENYQQWAEDRLAELAAEEAWLRDREREARRDLARELGRLQERGWGEYVLDIWSLPRGMAAAVDLPMLRQGMITLINHPKVWLDGLMTGVSTWTEGQMDAKVDALENHPLAGLMRASDLKQSSVEARRAPLSQLAREEGFQNQLARWLIHIRVSERQFTISMDQIRVQLFTRFAEPLLSTYAPSQHPEVYSELARLINIMTGIGDLGGMTSYTPLLNRIVFFSLRLLASRFQFLGMPATRRFWRDVPKPVRRIAMKEWVNFWSRAAGLMSLAVAAGISSLDPDDDEFVKLRIPGTNQRWEPLGGYSNYLKFITRLLRSAYREGTGQREFLGERPQDYIQQFFRSKLGPTPGHLWSWFTGRDYLGRPFEVKNAAIESVVPFLLPEMYEAVKLDGAKGLLAIPYATLGGGVSVYRSRKQPDRTGSYAERMATGLLRERMGRGPETAQEHKRRTLIAELVAASKAGRPTEQILREIKTAGGPLTKKELERLKTRLSKTPLQYAYKYLSKEEKWQVLGVATEEERAMLEPKYRRKDASKSEPAARPTAAPPPM